MTAPNALGERFGIFEWYGRPLVALSAAERRDYARVALRDTDDAPACPFQSPGTRCAKQGGVCSIRRYSRGVDDALGPGAGTPVVVCPNRFEQECLPARWLVEIVGFDAAEAQVATEVAFMRGTETGKPAGKIDMVVASTSDETVRWYGLEVQAVYFSGKGMRSEFERLRDGAPVRFPDAVRRPDWRSSSAKRLMPQLQIKVPTLRRWQAKMAVVVDRSFFNSIGGPSPAPSRDLGDGDIIWMVVDMDCSDPTAGRLTRDHWEVMTLEASSDRLLAAETVPQQAFLDLLQQKLRPIA